jgi:hypothetical protein
MKAAAKEWAPTVEQTVVEELITEWQRAWDELTDLHQDGVGEHTDTDAMTQRKRPDAWAVGAAVHWGKRCLLILEFTRPNDRDVRALQDTDTLKTARYTPLRDRLTMLLPAWEVEIQIYTIGIHGSHDQDRWNLNLTRLGLPASPTEALIRDLTLQALTELTDLYSV